LTSIRRTSDRFSVAPIRHRKAAPESSRIERTSMGQYAITQTVTTEFIEVELGESLLTPEEEQELLELIGTPPGDETSAEH